MVAFPRHLLVVLDGSVGDRGALEVAASAGRAGLTVTVLIAGTSAVVQRLRPLARGEDLPFPDAAESYVEAAAQALRQRGVGVANAVYAPASDATEAIAFYANRHDVGLILLPAAGSRGGRLRRGLAERLAAEAAAPVVVLPPPAPAPAEAA